MKKHKYGWKNKSSVYCSDELWRDFKRIIPDEMTINDYLVYLISREVDSVRRGDLYDVNGILSAISD
ncbi:MAG: hypothetical protein ACTSPI_15630 [Candidatus Heimdallarchaeaceae archaeon]